MGASQHRRMGWARLLAAALLMTWLGLAAAPSSTVRAAVGTFSNPAPITINDDAVATPYPSTIGVFGLSEQVTRVTVDLFGFAHDFFPYDVDVLLVGPSGKSVVLMSNDGGTANISGLDLTFDDAGVPIPEPITSGFYRPTGFSTYGPFTPPAPAGPYGSQLLSFNGDSPNGVWQLYVRDNIGGAAGLIAGGWRLTIETGTPGISVTPASGLVTTEAGDGATFNVVLDTRPSAPVFVDLGSSDTGEGVVTVPASQVLEFTPANWNVPQGVFVRGQDDSLDDGDVAYTIVTAPAVSVDPSYDGLDAADVAVTNADDDTAGIAVSPTFLAVPEGAAASFQVALASEPTADVTIPLTSSFPAQGDVSPASLTFTPANWNTPQSAAVSCFDDQVDDGDIGVGIVTVPASSGDPGYAGLNPLDVGVLCLDDDQARIEIAPLFGTTTEGGGSFQISVVLGSQPTANVLIGMASSDATEGSVDPPAGLTFTSASWNVPQLVTVTGLDDFLDDEAVFYTILTSSSSGDPLYDAIDPDDVTAVNLDDDGAGITATPSFVTTGEAGASATISVVLDSQPTADVTLPITSYDPSEVLPVPASLTFTPGNWNAPQTVTLFGVNDDVMDGDSGYLVEIGPGASADLLYAGMSAFVSGLNLDDDVAGVIVSPTSGLVTTEAGGGASFTVVLTSEPTADVTVSLLSTDPGEGNVAPAALTFTPGNWDTPQTAAVSGVDDSVDDGDVAYAIVTAVGSADPLYDGMFADDVAATNLDNDAAGFVVELSGNETSESGGTASFTVRLASAPSADVSFTLGSSDLTEGLANPAGLNFTPLNWNTPQQVTMTGVDDDVDDGDIVYTIVTGAAASGDPLYDGRNPVDPILTNLDDDTAGIVVSPISNNTDEAGRSATFTVALTSEPTADVTIGLSSDDTSEGTISPAGLTFTPASWDAPQTVTVAGVNDDLDDGDILYTIVTAPAASADGKYDGIDPDDVDLFNLDDDGAGFEVLPGSTLSTSEGGGTASFTVVLQSQPTANVVIALSSSDVTEGLVACDAKPDLTFTPDNWDVRQTCTVTGVDDEVDDGDIGYTILLAAAVSNDPIYSGMDPLDVGVVNLDDDQAAIIVAPTGGRVTTEAGGTATFTVVLGSEPTDDVTVPLSSGDTSEGAVSPASLTFTPLNWSSPRTVTITGVDDDLDDGDQAYQVITGPAVSADASYDLLNALDVSATNVDNDAAGITVSPTNGLFTGEAGGTATFTVALDSRPSGDVTIGLSSSDTTEGTVSPPSLTFTPAGWNVPQTVTLTGVDDDVDDGNIVYSIITGGASSADPAYAALNPADVTATNTDDDTAGIVATPAGGLFTSEAGGAATFTVALSSEPTDEVTLALSSSDTGEGTVSPASLTFSALNWSAPRTVTVSGVDDALTDGNQDFAVALEPSSGDPRYDALAPLAVTVTNTDNEPGSPTGTFQFSAATYSIGEQGGALVVQVRRVGGGSGAVSVQYRTEDASATAPADYGAVSGTFTWADGDVADKSFSVPIVDDALAESGESFSLVLSAPTGGASLGAPSTATVSIADNDLQPTVRFSAAEYTAREVDAAAVITIVRGGSTAGPLTVEYVTGDGTAAAPGDYLSASGTLSWGAGDATPRSFTVAVIADALDEGDETVLLTLRNPGPGAALGSPSSATLRIVNVAQLQARVFLPFIRR